jgi:uncharacterized membrane protein required for colicin V production
MVLLCIQFVWLVRGVLRFFKHYVSYVVAAMIINGGNLST